MRILKHGRQQPYLGACADCGCEFECQLTDGAIPRGKDWLLVCPECRKLVTLVAKADDRLKAQIAATRAAGFTTLTEMRDAVLGSARELGNACLICHDPLCEIPGEKH